MAFTFAVAAAAILMVEGQTIPSEHDAILRHMASNTLGPKCVLVLQDVDSLTAKSILTENCNHPWISYSTDSPNRLEPHFVHDNSACAMIIVQTHMNVDDGLMKADRALAKIADRTIVLLVTSINILTGLKSSLGAEDKVLIVESNNQSVHLYRWCSNQNEVNLEAVWGPGEDVDRATIDEVMQKKKCDHIFNGKHLRISARGLPPFNIFGGPKIVGVDVDLVQILADTFNFTYHVFLAPIAGKIDDTSGKWIGVVGSVVDGNSTFGIGNMALDPARFAVLDYTTMLYAFDTAFVSPKPRMMPNYINVIRPFPFLIWAIICFALILITSLMFLIVVVTSQWEWPTPLQKAKAERSAIMFSYAALLKQDTIQTLSENLLRSPTMRLLIVWWSIFCFIITAAYTCNLRAYLISSDYERAIDSTKDIIELDRNFYIPDGTSLEESIRTSPLEDYKILYQRAVARNTLFRIDKGWLPKDLEKEFLAQKGAFLFPKEPVQMMMKQFKSRLGYQPYRLSKQVGFSYHSGFLIPKYVPWKRDLDRVLIRLVESGIIQKLIRGYFPQIDDEEVLDDAGPKAFRNSHLLGPYIILGIGMLVAAIAFLNEVRKRKRTPEI